jgi:hopene-associated glycosyltransferase HpnB
MSIFWHLQNDHLCLEMIWDLIALSGTAIWITILLLPWRPWCTRESLDVVPDCPPEELGDVTVLIPARNEAELIHTALAALKIQGPHLTVIITDDQSKDGTVKAALGAGLENLLVISGLPLPSGWTGKLWALEQARREVKTRLTLLMDADIELRPGSLATLRATMQKKNLQLISLMAALNMTSFWEKLLMPAFVYFFRLLYPFRLSNAASSRMAAAAGGCILVETRVLEDLGGFAAWRGELIDDCALARRVKSLGYQTWIGLTHSVRSLRRYGDLEAIWNMVARTAFKQLRYSTLLLMLCTLLMVICFVLPPAALLFPKVTAVVLAAVGLGAMLLSYLPTLKYYGISRVWVLALPLVGTLYLAMTWTSAIRYWRGRGSQWKGRTYSRS